MTLSARLLILLAVIGTLVTPIAFGEGYDYVYSCRLQEHLLENGRIDPNSKYKYFLCIQKKRKHSTNVALRHAAAMTLPGAGGGVVVPRDSVAVDESPEDDTQDHNMVFSISNVPVEEYDDTATHQYHTIGLIDVKNREVAMERSFGSSTIREDVMDDVLDRFTRSRHFNIEGIGPCGDFDYEVSVATQLSMEDVIQLRDKAAKMVKDAKNVVMETELDKLPMYGYFKRVIWPAIKSVYSQGTNYLPLGLTAAGIVGLSYSDALRKAAAIYEAPEEPNLAGCLVVIKISTSEILDDMHRQGITTKLFTVRDTIGEIYQNVIDNDMRSAEFQTTGRFREFLSDDCHCPRCGSDGGTISNTFGRCDVDVIVSSNFMFINLLELYQGDLNSSLAEVNPISGYISSAPNWTFPPKTQLEIIGNFTHQDSSSIVRNTTCGCDPCPLVETSASQSATGLLVTTVNSLMAVVLTMAILGAKWAFTNIIAKVRTGI